MEKDEVSATLAIGLSRLLATIPTLADGIISFSQSEAGNPVLREIEDALGMSLINPTGTLPFAAKLHLAAQFASELLAAEKLPTLDAETVRALAKARSKLSPPALPLLSAISAVLSADGVVADEPGKNRRKWIAADLLAADIVLLPLIERLSPQCEPISDLLAKEETKTSISAALKRVSYAAMNLAYAETVLGFGGGERLAVPSVGAAFVALIDTRRFLRWRAPDGLARGLRIEVEKRLSQESCEGLVRVTLARSLLDEARELIKLEK